MHYRRLIWVFWLGSTAAAVNSAAQSGELESIEIASETREESEGFETAGDSSNEAGTTAKGSEESSSADAGLKRLREERDRLAAENALAQEQLRQELFAMQAEKQRLSLENSLRSERLAAEAADLKSELDRMNLEIDVASKRAALDQARRRVELEVELNEMRAEEERLKAANALANQKMESRFAEMRLRESEYKTRKAALEIELAELQAQLSVREKADILRDLAPAERNYTLEPYKDGVLRISDRRIALNGVISVSVADHIAQRVDYFNNQNTEFPIFLVIESSPGGSVMAGYKILKAMEGSQAPVNVVVKSYAASMAAVIATTAEQSFAYPNAIILHHQLSWFGTGNLTQQREQLEEAQRWWRRLAAPVAAKMGLTLDEFITQMYQKNSDGNWVEFGDGARELNWIDETVDRIWETALDKNPDRFGERPVVGLALEEKVDSEGKSYVLLPRLSPFDAYFIYNQDHYYRLR